jgi:hypothetical protein
VLATLPEEIARDISTTSNQSGNALFSGLLSFSLAFGIERSFKSKVSSEYF